MTTHLSGDTFEGKEQIAAKIFSTLGYGTNVAITF